MTILPSLLIALALPLIVISTPLTLGLWILMITLSMLVLLTTITSSWLAMAIFLIYVGGLLVLFAYFLAVQPNNFLNVSSYFFMTLISFSLIKSNTNPSMMMIITPANLNMSSMPFILTNTNLSLLLIIGAILLLILVVVVKITFVKKGPLRPFM